MFGTYGMETWSDIISRRGQYNFVPGTAPKLAERPSLPPVHWVSGLFFRTTRQIERETNYLLSSRSGLNVWSHTSPPSNVFMACCLIKQKNDFTLTYCGMIIQNTNVMHLILFIRQIFSSTCFEQQVLIFRRNSCMWAAYGTVTLYRVLVSCWYAAIGSYKEFSL